MFRDDVVCLKFELTCSSGSQFEQYTDKEDILFSKSSTKSRFKWSVHVSSESSITIVKPAHTTSEFRPDIQTAPNSACPPHLLEATSTCLPTPSPLHTRTHHSLHQPPLFPPRPANTSTATINWPGKAKTSTVTEDCAQCLSSNRTPTRC
jgi:hypothetical protein